MAEKTTTKKTKKVGDKYVYIPPEKFQMALQKAKEENRPSKEKLLKKIYKKQEKIRETREAKRELGVSKRPTISQAKEKAFSTQESYKKIAKRAKAVRGLLTAAGVIQGKQTYAGAGRPRGTYKYGMPIHEYKKLMSQKKAQYQQYQQEQYRRLAPKGFTPEQIQALQQKQAMEELETPRQYDEIEQIPEQQQMPRQMQAQPQQMQQPQLSQRNIADEELEFLKWSSEKTVHPNTQRILDSIRRIQLKGQRDNIEQQRRHRERMMVGRSMNLMKAHENMSKISIDFTGVNSRENILFAPSVFKNNPENNIMRPRERTVLDMRENNLRFFTDQGTILAPNQENILRSNDINILNTAARGNNLKFF